MDASLQPHVSCCLITTLISLRKEDIGEIDKNEKYNQKYVRIL